jgi:membrane protease YdiL (CAAX protease family)
MTRPPDDATPLPAPVWFAVALVPMVLSQIARLHQVDPGAWIFWDYAGRFGGLAVLAATAPRIAFRREPLRMPPLQVLFWVVGIVLADAYVGGAISTAGNAHFPSTVLGSYPQLSGWLYRLDITFGIALVAFSEEVVFRRCARAVFRPRFGDGWRLTLVTALLFGAYHWWTGVGNVLEAAFMGVLFMAFHQRSGALWPVVLSHYLTDIVSFA